MARMAEGFQSQSLCLVLAQTPRGPDDTAKVLQGPEVLICIPAKLSGADAAQSRTLL